MDDLFFAGIVVAIFCLVLAMFSRALVEQWDMAPVAAVAIAGKPMQQPIERPLVKVSVKGNLPLPTHQGVRRAYPV